MQAVARAAYAPAQASLEGVPDVIGSIAGDMREAPAWVIEDDGVLAGFLIARVAGAALKLVNLAVDPEHGGKGLARQLLGAADSLARAEGLDRIELTTHAGMGATRAMYRHLGWVEMQVTEHAVLLSKTL